MWQRTGLKISRRLWWNTRFPSDMVACYVVFIISIADTFHGKRWADVVHAVTTDERATFSRAVVITQMTTKVSWRSERPSAVGRPAEGTSLPWHDIRTGWLRILYRMVIDVVASAGWRLSSQRQIRRIWGHSLIEYIRTYYKQYSLKFQAI